MHVRGIIPPLVTPMRADEELDLPPPPPAHRPPDRQRRPRHLRPRAPPASSTPWTRPRSRRSSPPPSSTSTGGCRCSPAPGPRRPARRSCHTQMAEREGADGVSVITPYFITPTPGRDRRPLPPDRREHALPVVLYNNPSTCGGLKIEPDTVARLAEVKNIVGIKDSSGDLQNMIETVRTGARPVLACCKGRDTLIAPALMFGAKGAVPASCEHRPEAVRRDLRGVRGRRLRAVEGGPGPAEPGAAGADDRHGPRGGEAGDGPTGRTSARAARRLPRSAREAGEVEGDFGGGGAGVMSGPIPPCRTVRVSVFPGDNSRSAVRALRAAFNAERGRWARPGTDRTRPSFGRRTCGSFARSRARRYSGFIPTESGCPHGRSLPC